MTKEAFYVYAYFRLDGTPCYVGKGKGERWRHRGKYGRNKHFLNIRAQAKAIGLDLPCIKLVEGLTDAEAMQIELDLIHLVGREANGGPLVNLTDGGDGASGYKWTPELNALNPRFRGHHHSDESKAATRAKLKGKPKSPEHIEAAANALRGTTKSSGWWSTEEGRAKQRQNNRGNTGCKYSAEACEKIRRASVRQHASANARKMVKTSPAWSNLNSIRYQPMAA
jgi:hypothetical protein